MPHGTGIFTYMWPKFMGFYVGKYASPMDPMGKEILRPKPETIAAFIC